MGDRAFASATELTNQIRDRRIGCVELLDFYLARAERHNPTLNAIVVWQVDQARERARAADAALARGERVFRARSRVPLGSVRHLTGVIRRWSFQERPHLAVHRPSACSGVKALRNTSDARRQAAKLCYRFGPLTPSARSANLIAGDGTKNGFPAPNKELPTNQK